jgi:hypothetical protein
MAKPEPITKQRRDLWQDLNETIHKNAGAVVSRPNISPIRFECQEESDLPWHLSRCGFEVCYIGTNERLWPIKGGHVAPAMIAVYELDLPSPPSTDRRIP